MPGGGGVEPSREAEGFKNDPSSMENYTVNLKLKLLFYVYI